MGSGSAPGAPREGVVIGVLALQGDFEAHARTLDALGAAPREVRTAGELDDLDALILPGGESTSITLGLERDGMAQPLRDRVRDGLPVLGTCAGMILMDGAHLGLMDIDTRRNAFGRQLRSFESDVAMAELGEEPVRGVFIRAPWVERCGAGVEVLGELDGRPVAVREGRRIAVAFHPELAGETRVHRMLLDVAGAAGVRGSVQVTGCEGQRT